jgi:hypothetical protein
MDTEMKLGTQLVQHAMNFDIIVTYETKRDTAAKLMNAQQLLRKSQHQVFGHQAHFEINIMVNSMMTYDAVMTVVRGEVEHVSEQVLGIKPSEIVKISTCADWHVWEKLTGRSSAEDDAVSAICRHGKFWF